MKSLFLSRRAKIVIDILLVVGLFLAGGLSDFDRTSDNYWESTHCIIGLLWFSLIIIHVGQHWRFIKSLTKKKVISKNKVTTITTICFILMFVSVLSFIIGFKIPLLKFHNVIGHVFALMVIIHTINKSKRFISLLKK